eukprot:CAMPEP_0176421890 /NCGR_PEP_ID=MMETSP0127-20121128/9432_1 /TAXON_ID=938130 /ORGANISM="Platyophrya macrostoma, Strain WH" /LENGTH=161 /DNA_ID=CAMNT_0017802685 /DNA_START=85 /DNA_END=567 /DNA_ORIENTATION=+
MMSKAAFFMNEHMKRNTALVNQVHPSAVYVRGRMPFQQGLDFIAHQFRGKVPAEMYCHSYFIEKQTDPTQPSPQFHLTEEYQGMLKVMKGLQYMNDKSAKLDTTAVLVKDDASGDVFVYNPVDMDESVRSMLMTQLASWGVEGASKELQQMQKTRETSSMV